jgi:hypothetical protein
LAADARPDVSPFIGPGRGLSFSLGTTFFPFAVLWLDAEQTLVDCRLVQPWALVVAPKCAAASFVEGAPELLDRVSLGDQIVLKGG